jgi:hypothetical protein
VCIALGDKGELDMIKKAGILAVIIVVHGFVTGSLRAEIVILTPNSNSVVEGGIEYYIQTDKAVYDLGENVDILYRVTNLTENPITLGEGHRWPDCYGFIVKDNADNNVWLLPRDIPILPTMNFGLSAYGSREYERLWNMMNDNGTSLEIDDFPVSTGLYTVTGELWLYEPYEKVPVSVSIEIIPEPCSLVLLGTCFVGIILARKKDASVASN